MRCSCLVLAVLGLIGPYDFFISYLLEFDLDFNLLIQRLFRTPILVFFGFDLLIPAIIFLCYSFNEWQRVGVANRWVYLLSTLLVGPSCSFPLFVYIREGKLRGQKEQV